MMYTNKNLLKNSLPTIATVAAILTALYALYSIFLYPIGQVRAADNNFVVDTTNATADDNPGDGICEDASGDCSWQAAVEEANANAGETTEITFDAALYGGGAANILLYSANEFTEAITVTGPGASDVVLDLGEIAHFTFGAGSDGSSISGVYITQANANCIDIEDDNITLSNVTIDDCQQNAVYSQGNSGLTVTGSTILNYGQDNGRSDEAIDFWDGPTDVTITNNTITGNGGTDNSEAAVKIAGGASSGIIITGNTITNADEDGITVQGTDITVSNNTITDPLALGVTIGSGSSTVVVNENTISGTDEDSIQVAGTPTSVTVHDNEISDSAAISIDINTGANVTVTDNEVTNSTTYGIVIGSGVTSVTDVSGNTIDTTGGTALGIVTDSVSIGANTITNATGGGIGVLGDDITVTGGSVSNSDIGIVFDLLGAFIGTNSTVDGVTLTNNTTGVDFSDSGVTGNTITDVTITGSTTDVVHATDPGDTNTFDNTSIATSSVTAGTLDVNFDVRVDVTDISSGDDIESATVTATDADAGDTAMGSTNASGLTSYYSLDAYQLTSGGATNVKNDYTFTASKAGYDDDGTTTTTINTPNQTVSVTMGTEDGGGIITYYQCFNGLDDDGDGYVDYPDDPGCSDSNDVTESPNPACSDGDDNDDDGLIDEADPGCVDIYDTSEVDAVEGTECGNGQTEEGETCDDGNLTNGDGCDSSCQTEITPVCGNGEVESGETCDDGNLTDGDGCDASCQEEDDDDGEETEAVCGNGIVEAGEDCDGSTFCTNDCSVNACTADGLVAYWSFDVIDPQVTDFSGNGHHATPTALTSSENCVQGDCAQFEYFSSSNAVVSDTADLALQQLTTEAWFKAETPNSNSSFYILARGEAAPSGNINYGMLLAGGPTPKLYCYFEDSRDADWRLIWQPTAGILNDFVHMACVLNGDTWQMYVNGQLVDAELTRFAQPISGLNGAIPSAMSSPLWLGAYQSVAEGSGNQEYIGGYFWGVIDEVAIYDTALTATQIAGRYNSGSGRQCGFGTQSEVPIPVCGNGAVESGETCDDGNLTNGDGCDSSCQEEDDPIEITPECGNGIIEAGEECDGGDNCTDSCTTVVIETPEGCDYGNPACPADFICQNNSCVTPPTELTGCAYNNPACPSGYRCVNNSCSLIIAPPTDPEGPSGSGCQPACDEGYTCVDDSCQAVTEPTEPAEGGTSGTTTPTEPADNATIGIDGTARRAVLAILESPVVKQISQALDNPVVERVTANIATPAIITLAVVNLLAAAPTLSFLPYLLYVLTEPFRFLFYRRRKYGAVYNSITKQPVDLAVVRLYNATTNQLVKTTVTDSKGRYSIVADPGEYYLKAVKNDYVFPSKTLGDAVRDNQFADLYYGAPIRLTDKDNLVNLNIPLDPNVEKQPDAAVILKHQLKKLQGATAYIGPALALVALVIVPSAALAYIFIAHIILFLLFRRLAAVYKPKSYGTIFDGSTKKAIPGTVVRIFDTKYNKLLAAEVANSAGHYNFLVGSNSYYLTASKTHYQPYKSEDLDYSDKSEVVIDKDVKLQPIGAGR